MGDILIRNLDEGVIDALKIRAKGKGRSLQTELHKELTRLAQKDRKQKAMEIAGEIAARADMSKLQCDSWEFIREDRDMR